MNTNLASYIMGMVIDQNDHFYFVQKDGQTYALDKAEGPHQVGESVKGFAYTDMKQKLRLTTLEVTATQESVGWGTVTEVRKDRVITPQSRFGLHQIPRAKRGERRRHSNQPQPIALTDGHHYKGKEKA